MATANANDPQIADARTVGDVLGRAFAPPTAQKGSAGPIGLFGPTTQEHRWDLIPIQARMIHYRKARRFHSVQTGMELLLSLVLSAAWTVEPGRDAPKPRKYAEHIARSLGIATPSLGERAPTAMCGRSWDENLRSLMNSQFDGFACRELVCVDDGAGTLWTEIRYLDPATIFRMMADSAGRLAMVVQQPIGMFSGGGLIELEANRILHIGRQCEGTQFDGIGMLRPILQLVNDAARVQNVIASIVERWGLGTPLVTFDIEAAERCRCDLVGDPEKIRAEVDRWHRIMADYLTGSNTAIAPPPWIKISEFGGEVKGLSDLIVIMDGLDRRALQAFMAQFLVLGSGGGTGAYNVAETHSGAAIQMAEGILRSIVEQMKSYIRRALRWQFGPIDEADMPWLDFTGLQSPMFLDKLAEVVQLIQVGAVTMTDGVEDRIVKLLGLPPRTVSATPEERAARGAVAREMASAVTAAPGSGPASGTPPGNAA